MVPVSRSPYDVRMNALLHAAPAALAVEYPVPEELVSPERCIVQVSGPQDADRVEVSIDRGPWRPCVRACGYWWLDATELRPGEHRLCARGVLRDGTVVDAPLRRFTASAAAARRSRRKH
jgi:hypothetical protein